MLTFGVDGSPPKRTAFITITGHSTNVGSRLEFSAPDVPTSLQVIGILRPQNSCSCGTYDELQVAAHAVLGDNRSRTIAKGALSLQGVVLPLMSSGRDIAEVGAHPQDPVIPRSPRDGGSPRAPTQPLLLAQFRMSQLAQRWHTRARLHVLTRTCARIPSLHPPQRGRVEAESGGQIAFPPPPPPPPPPRRRRRCRRRRPWNSRASRDLPMPRHALPPLPSPQRPPPPPPPPHPPIIPLT